MLGEGEVEGALTAGSSGVVEEGLVSDGK